MMVNRVVAVMPEKVQKALNSGAIIDIGKEGARQYDYIHDIFYIVKGADETAIIHEIGYAVENKLMDSENVRDLKRRILEEVAFGDFANEIYYDTNGNRVEIFLIKNSRFVYLWFYKMSIIIVLFRHIKGSLLYEGEVCIWEKLIGVQSQEKT